MNINQLILLVKKKLNQNLKIEDLAIEDKTFLHKKHKSYREGSFHLKVTIRSNEFRDITKIDATKKIYSILKDELKNNIHSIQILIN